MEEVQHDLGDMSLEMHQSGPLVCMLPRLGGGIRRFAELGARLGAAGYRAVAIDPRGAGTSTRPLDGHRMRDLADDVARAIEHFSAPAIIGFTSRLS